MPWRTFRADRVRLHLCWGNFEGPHMRDIPLARIFDIAIKDASAQAISFEGANPRHEHEWKLFKDLAARRHDSDTGRAGLHHELRGAPELVARTDRALRGAGGPRKRHRRHRLWFLARSRGRS